MTQKVFVDIGMSLDGCVAGANRGPSNPMGGASMSIHGWFFAEKAFRERLGMPGGEEGPGGPMIRHTFDRIGANVMGRNMFDEGEVAWPEAAPFGCPVFVLTHRPREPWARPGGTTFHFVTDGLESALAQARAAAGDKDVRISGGAETVREALSAGVVDEMILHITPVLVGDGLRLFDGLGRDALAFEQTRVVGTPGVTHITYKPR